MNSNLNLLESIKENNFKYRDDDNNTILHLIIKYNLADDIKIKEILRLKPSFINVINNNHETALFYLTDYKLFDWIITNIDCDFNININNETVIHNLIEKNKINLIKKILISKPELLDIRQNNILIKTIEDQKNNISKMIINNFPDKINITDDDNITPFLYAIDNNNLEIFNLLLNKGVDINYSGKFNEYNPLVLALINNQEEIINKLIENGIDIDMRNNSNETFLHILFMNEQNLSDKLIIKIISKGDLLIKNINNKTPYDYIKEYKHYNKFNKIIEEKLKKSKVKLDKKIIKRNNFNLVKGKRNINYGLYFSTPIYNLLYLMNLLEKYDNLSLPIRNYENKKTDNLFISYNFFNNNIHPIIKYYFTLSYQITPSFIIWKNENEYYIDKHLKFYINKCLLGKRRFILLKLIIIISNELNHSNIFLYDKEKNRVERFEPYGVIHNAQHNQIDIFFENKFKEIFNKETTYLKPSDYFDIIGFQSLSNDHLIENKKIGDPGGYCLAWTKWYIEMRLNNLEYEPNEIINLAIFKIKNLNNKNKSNSFINFIRNYAYSLNEQKNKILGKIKIKKENFNNIEFDEEDKNKIISYINKFFKNFTY